MSKWGQKTNSKFTYIKPDDTKNDNKALKYASSIMKYSNTNVNILNDYDEIIKEGCVYIPKFFGDDNILFNKLKAEIDVNQMINWSKHQKYENPQFSKTFNEIIDKMAKHFNVKVLQTRMNYYKDTTAFKPMHKDSHAYYTDENGITMKENFTMGASFGFTRELDFVHESSGVKFTFPQKNNDIFCFNDKVNDKFLHGIPKISDNKFVKDSERISIIAWGIRMV
jgi:hypothetical protein